MHCFRHFGGMTVWDVFWEEEILGDLELDYTGTFSFSAI